MIVEIAIGDAYGAGFEFVKSETIEKEHKMDKYYASRIDDLKAGQYTDDTQMSLAIINLMLNYKHQDWTKTLIAKEFLEVFNRDKRCGYAQGFYTFLSDTTDEFDFLNNIDPSSVRNGAAMRSVPLSLIKDIEELKAAAELQASITHNTYEGIASSQAVALIGNYFLYQNGKKKDLKEYLLNELLEIFKDDKTDRCACDGIETVDAVITVLKNSSTFSEIIDKSVKLGGDTDSVASIACGLATFSDEFVNDLAPFFYNDLENKEFGHDYLVDLDKKILALKDKI